MLTWTMWKSEMFHSRQCELYGPRFFDLRAERSKVMRKVVKEVRINYSMGEQREQNKLSKSTCPKP